MTWLRRAGLALIGLAGVLMAAVPAAAQDMDTEAMIASAVSAGPASISADATVMDWSMNVLREGSNGWTCLPDDPNAEGNSPWCVDAAWMNFLEALVSGGEPSYQGMGVAYMLQGDQPICNSDFFASMEECPEGDWVTGLGAHMMLLVSDASMLDGMSTDHMNGGPWVMFPGTPFAHVMVPIENR
jgi:hypothetical protein